MHPGGGVAYNAITLKMLPWLFPVLALTACADGGEEEVSQSDVLIDAEHHLFGFRTLAGFAGVPVSSSSVVTSNGLWNTFDDSTYTLTLLGSTSSPSPYGLNVDGGLSIYVTGSGSEPSVVFQGGYDQVGTQANYFFTDRVSTPNSQSIGFFYGTPALSGQLELEGDWHLLSLHVITGAGIVSPDNVGRGAHGLVSMTAGDPGTQRIITGVGSQGGVNQTTTVMTYGGTARNLLDGQGVGNGLLNLTLEYTADGSPTDTRILEAAGNDDVIFGLDEDIGDGEAGLVTMVRAFDAVAAPADPALVPGTFLVGGHTLFVNPSNPGADAFVGTVTLSSPDGFRLDAVGNTGADFSYIGSFTLADDGKMTIDIQGSGEAWVAAISRDYNTFVVIDSVQESSPNPELNFVFGVRKQEPL